MYDTKNYRSYKPLDAAVTEFQQKNYGDRYLRATLSQLQADQPTITKLQQWLEKPKNFLVVIGPPGTGKTYMLAALTEWMFCTFNTFRTFKDQDILKKLRFNMSEGMGDWAEELRYLMDDQLTIIDDIGSGIDPHKDIQKSIEWRSEVLFTMLDLRYNSMLPTILTSNLSQENIRNIYSQRACSRMFAAENTLIDMSGCEDKRQQGL